jgi:sulfur-carrier protein
MALVRIPTPFRSLTRQLSEAPIAGKTVGEVLENLEKAFPGIGARVLDNQGAVRRYVNIFYNDEDIRFLEHLSTPVADGALITIVPAVAGG